MRLTDRGFRYTPSVSTNVLKTWKKHGFRPTTEAERNNRNRNAEQLEPSANPARVVNIRRV